MYMSVYVIDNTELYIIPVVPRLSACQASIQINPALLRGPRLLDLRYPLVRCRFLSPAVWQPRRLSLRKQLWNVILSLDASWRFCRVSYVKEEGYSPWPSPLFRRQIALGGSFPLVPQLGLVQIILLSTSQKILIHCLEELKPAQMIDLGVGNVRMKYISLWASDKKLPRNQCSPIRGISFDRMQWSTNQTNLG